MSVKITETAAKEIKRVMEEQEMGDDVYLKIEVSGGGCSGFNYGLGFEEKENLEEKRFLIDEQHDIKVAVCKKSDLFLDGTTVDFYTDLSKRGFTFDNPNAVKSCGCGSSFSCG